MIVVGRQLVKTLLLPSTFCCVDVAFFRSAQVYFVPTRGAKQQKRKVKTCSSTRTMSSYQHTQQQLPVAEQAALQQPTSLFKTRQHQ